MIHLVTTFILFVAQWFAHAGANVHEERRSHQAEFDRLEKDVAGLKPMTALEKAYVQLFRRAIAAGRKGNYPVASGMLARDGSLSCVHGNESIVPRPKSSAHAEMVTLDEFEASGKNADDFELVTTLEPCAMCTARIAYAKVRQIQYLVADPIGGTIPNHTILPPSFTTALEDAKFQRFSGPPAYARIGQRLHEVGEKIWAK